MLDLVFQRRVEAATHRPVIVEVAWGGGEHLDLAGIDLARRHQLFPDAGVKDPAIGLTGLYPGRSGIVGTGIGNAAEVGFWLDAILEHEVARHQAARSGRNGTEGKGLALEVGQALHI
ncbi:hypothetical protein D3C72_2203900 [compost metagenome]